MDGRRRVAVVTGASAGVGRAVAVALAEHGFDVALLARGEAGLDAAAKEVEAAGGRALAIPTDVAVFGDRGVAGVVKSVNGGSLSVAAEDGSTVTVTTSSSTGVTLVNPSSVGALHVGDQIRVIPASGSNPSSGTITAAAIRAGALGR